MDRLVIDSVEQLAAAWADPTPQFVVPPHIAPPVAPLPLTDHFLFQTSGSTGPPKWIALAKNALTHSAAAVNEHLRVSSASRWGLALPIHHVGGFGIIVRARQANCAVVVFAEKWNPAAFTNWCTRQEISHTSLVPTQVFDLVHARLTAPRTLQTIVVGGGELPVSLGQSARDLGWPVLASYGMTEAASQIATQHPAALTAPFSNHPLPLLPHWHAQQNPDGRLLLSGPSLFSGTWTEKTGYLPRTENAFLTADLVERSPLGLSPHGRADQLVKILGELVNPTAIENALIALAPELAAHLVVIAVPDIRRGHRLVPVSETPFRASLIAQVATYNSSAPGFLRLEAPRFFPSLPRSPLHKLLRTEIITQILHRSEGI